MHIKKANVITIITLSRWGGGGGGLKLRTKLGKRISKKNYIHSLA